MGMEIPDELANLFYGLTGTRWPDVDETRLRDLSDMYATVEYILASELPELVVVLRRRVRSTFDSRTTEYFEESLAQFTAGERDYIGEAAQLAGDIRVYAREAANQVEYAKWMIIGQLIQLVLEIAWAIAMAKWTFGASLAWIEIFRFVRREAIRRILNRLLWGLLSHLFMAQLFGTTMDLLIQRIQMDQGNRDQWDRELTRMSAAGAFVEGLLSAGLSFGADLFLGGQLARLFGRNLPDPPTPPPLVREAVPDPTVPPPVRSTADDAPAATPDALPPGSVTPEFNRDLVTLFGRNSNEFLNPTRRPGVTTAGIDQGQRFLDGAGRMFALHFGEALGEAAARDLGRSYAETLLRTWNTPGRSSALDDVLASSGLPQATREYLARDVPDAFAVTLRDFGSRLQDRAVSLGIGAAAGAVEGYLGEGLTNVAFAPDHTWQASGMSAVSGAVGSVVQDLAVSGGIGAIDALQNLRLFNGSPVPEGASGGEPGDPPSEPLSDPSASPPNTSGGEGTPADGTRAPLGFSGSTVPPVMSTGSPVFSAPVPTPAPVPSAAEGGSRTDGDRTPPTRDRESALDGGGGSRSDGEGSTAASREGRTPTPDRESLTDVTVSPESVPPPLVHGSPSPPPAAPVHPAPPTPQPSASADTGGRTPPERGQANVRGPVREQGAPAETAAQDGTGVPLSSASSVPAREQDTSAETTTQDGTGEIPVSSASPVPVVSSPEGTTAETMGPPPPPGGDTVLPPPEIAVPAPATLAEGTPLPPSSSDGGGTPVAPTPRHPVRLTGEDTAGEDGDDPLGFMRTLVPRGIEDSPRSSPDDTIAIAVVPPTPPPVVGHIDTARTDTSAASTTWEAARHSPVSQDRSQRPRPVEGVSPLPPAVPVEHRPVAESTAEDAPTGGVRLTSGTATDGGPTASPHDTGRPHVPAEVKGEPSAEGSPGEDTASLTDDPDRKKAPSGDGDPTSLIHDRSREAADLLRPHGSATDGGEGAVLEGSAARPSGSEGKRREGSEVSVTSSMLAPRRLNYLIESEWIESYGVHVDPARVLEALPDLPDDIAEAVTDALTLDPRAFFRRGGIEITGEGVPVHTLVLSSVDDWHRLPGNRAAPAPPKYKGLHDVQEQVGTAETGVVGSNRRLGFSVQGTLLSTAGVPIPVPGIRVSAGSGSSSWQQSGDLGHTRIQTTEMTGRDEWYATTLNVSLTVGDTTASATLGEGVRLTVMGGLTHREDLPPTITFDDPFTTTTAAAETGRYGGYLSHAHPISIGDVTLRTAPATAPPRNTDDPPPAPDAPRTLGQWVADRLGLEEPVERPPLRRRVLHRRPPGSDEPGVVEQVTPHRPDPGAQRYRRVAQTLAPDNLMSELPSFTDGPRTMVFHDADGRPRTVTLWSYPILMENVPDVPKDFNLKHTDRLARGNAVVANRTSGFQVRPGIGVMERVPGDIARVEAPYIEFWYGRERGDGRGHSVSGWDARLFHGTENGVYRIQRGIAVWLEGDARPTVFDTTTLETLGDGDVHRLFTGPPVVMPVGASLTDAFLGRDRVTHLGDALVRDVTFEDGAPMRWDGQGRPLTVFRDYAHRLLNAINALHPGLVLPHLALYGDDRPRDTHTGWSSRRNDGVAVLNTARVLAAVDPWSFRVRRDEWLSTGVEVKLVETKKIAWRDEFREHTVFVPRQISVWLAADVVGFSEAPPARGENTGGTTGSSAGIRRREFSSQGYGVEVRAGAVWRGVDSGVDSAGLPAGTGGGGARLAGEWRSGRQREGGRSVTAEDNVKDKSGSRRMFATVEFSAWQGPRDSVVPRSARTTPTATGTSGPLVPAATTVAGPARAPDATDPDAATAPEPPGIGPRVRVRMELRTPWAGSTFPYDPALPHGFGGVRTLTGAPARTLFREGAFSLGRPLPSRPSPALEAIREADEDGADTVPTPNTPDPNTPTPDLPVPHVPEPPAPAPPVPARRSGSGAPAVGRDRGARPDGNPGLPVIVRTDAARRLDTVMRTVQAFDPTIERPRADGTAAGRRPVTVLSYTYAGLDRDHWSFSRSVERPGGVGGAIANRLSPQALAGSPGLIRRHGDRLRVQNDDGIAPTRTRPTVVTWYVPTRISWITARPSAVVESSQTREVTLGSGTSGSFTLFFAVGARGGFNPNPTAATAEQAPERATDPTFQPSLETRYTLYGRPWSRTSSTAFRARTEIKLTGHSFEFVTDGVIAQAIEHKQDFSLAVTVPRAAGDDAHTAWLAPVTDAQKVVVPALWAYIAEMVPDRLSPGPDGRPAVGSQAPPPPVRPGIEVMADLVDKGYQSRPVDPTAAVDRLIDDLTGDGWELTGLSREELIHIAGTHLNRSLTDMPPLRIRVRAAQGGVNLRWGSDRRIPALTTRVRGVSREAVVRFDVRLRDSRVEHMGGRMEFIERVVLVRGSAQSAGQVSGWSTTAAADLLFPVDQGRDPGTGSQTGVVQAGGNPSYRYQSDAERSSSLGSSTERTHERVVFTPYAIVTSAVDVHIDLTFNGGEHHVSAPAGRSESVHPVPYLAIGDTWGREPSGAFIEEVADPEAPPPRPDLPSTGVTEITRAPGAGNDALSLVQGWVGDLATSHPEYTGEEGGVEATPVAVGHAGRGVFDAAVVAAARAHGWESEATGELTAAEVAAARTFLTDASGAGLIDPIGSLQGETVLRGLTPDAVDTDEGAVMTEFGRTRVGVKALLNTRGATMVSVGGNSRARDSAQEGVSESLGSSANTAHSVGGAAQLINSGRPRDRLRENPLEGESTAAGRVGESSSSAQRSGATAQGPGTLRTFLVRIPTRWLAWAEVSGKAPRAAGVWTDAPVLRWIDEREAREWGMDTTAPVIDRLVDAETAFDKADKDYLTARSVLYALVGEHGTTAREWDPNHRSRYGQAQEVFEKAQAERVTALRALEDALAGFRRWAERPRPAPKPAPTPPAEEGTAVEDAALEGDPPEPVPPTPSGTSQTPQVPVEHGGDGEDRQRLDELFSEALLLPPER